jgi:hypothetical protein
VDDFVFKKEKEKTDPDVTAKIEKALSQIEGAVVTDIEKKGDRPVVYEGNQHLIVGGNVLYHDDEENGLRVIPLSRYVLKRGPNGEVIEIVIKESFDIHQLPDAVRRNLIQEETGEDGETSDSNSGKGVSSLSTDEKHKRWTTRGTGGDKDIIDVFTHIRRKNPETWAVVQECCGKPIDGTEGTYKNGKLPWIPVRMYQIAGEDYGRSYVESYIGDLMSLEVLTKAVVEASALAARVIYFVHPGGFVRKQELHQAPNGAVLEGKADDVTALQLQKNHDLQITQAEIQMLTDRLRVAFLMVEGVRRQGERVTAEEIRLVAQELESGLGGVYTVISQEFQLPYITERLDRLTESGKIPQLPGDVVGPSIVTGFEALGRGNDKQKLIEFLEILFKTLGGETAIQYINPQNAIMRLAAASGISTEGLVKDEQQLAQEQQAAMEMQQQQQVMDMAKQASPELVKQFAGGVAGQQMGQEQQQQ